MKPRQWPLGAVAAVAATFTGLAHVRADEPAKPSAGPYVVIVGVGEFQDKAIQPRPTADADAKALYDTLTDPKFLGVPADRAVLLLSKSDDQRKAKAATHEAVVEAINKGIAETGKDDLLIVAVFGRGASVADKTCFFTPDTVLKERAKTAVVGSDLEPALKKLKTQRFLLLLDVAYRGFDPGPGAEKIAEPTMRDITTAVFGGEDKEDNALPPDRLIIMGNLPSQDPLSKDGSSVFASTLLAALKGAADTPPHNEGYESDGLVTTDELTKYLEKEVPNQARQIGKNNKEKELTPFMVGEQTTSFRVTRNPAVTEKTKARLEKLAATAKAGTVTEDEAKEGAVLLARMPKLKSGQELRRAYQRLVDGTETAEQFKAERAKVKASLTLAPAEARSYAKKVNDAVELVGGVYIKATDPGDLTAAAIRGMYRRIREPLPADLEAALKDTKGMTEAKRLELLEQARMKLGSREDLEGDKAADLSVLMMLFHLNDPYTSYTDRETKRQNQSRLQGRFSGVGISIRRDAVRDGLLVVSPIKGSPAYAAGIQAGDLITEIRRTVDPEGKPLKPDDLRTFSTKGMKTEDAIKIILGNPGTPITLVVQREGEKEPKVFELKRNWVAVETVLGVQRKEDTDWTYYVDPAYKIAYIHLTQFTQNTAPTLRRVIQELKQTGLNGLVLDLRFDPGGYLTSAIDIGELFVGQEKIVTVRPRVGRVRQYSGDRRGETGFPMVVLVNGQSASASEIVAACLQDHGRAVVVGEKSFGKGSVQDVLQFDQTGGEIKLTIARYFPPSDRNIDKLAADQDSSIKDWGVKPNKGYDVELSREERNELFEHLRDLEVIKPKGGTAAKEEAKPFKDKQLDKALEYLRDQIKAEGKAPKKNNG
jgi:C-terminal peptidase prc